jgi:hypothetical protein
MYGTDAFLKHEASRRSGREKKAMDCYQGVELAPCTLESLVTWDVSLHAQREKDRMSSAYRNPRAVHGGY